MASPVVVSGLADLQRAFREIAPIVEDELKAELRRAIDPVAKDAQTLAQFRIRGMRTARRRAKSREGVPWSEMRVEVTLSSVYVAPKQRGVKTRNPFDPRRRPNLFDLLLGEALEPALDRNAAAIEVAAGRALDRVVTAWEEL